MKTGTSAIQSFLANNPEFLNRNGLYFPETNRNAMNYLAFSLLDKVPPYVHQKLDVTQNDLYKQLKKEIDLSKSRNIIISTEAYSLISTSYFMGSEAPKVLKEILNERHYDFKIIASIRKQDDYLISQYNQHIKTHNFNNLFYGNIGQFYDDKKELFDFNTILKRWEKVFGKENIILSIYDKRKDSVEQFLKLFNIDSLVGVEGQKNVVNKKLTNKGLEFMRLANKYDAIKKTARQNYLLVDLIEEKLPENKTEPRLPDSILQKIKLDFYESNQDLSNKYFNGNMSWFNLESKTEDESHIENLTVEDAVKVAVNIWNHYQNHTNNNEL